MSKVVQEKNHTIRKIGLNQVSKLVICRHGESTWNLENKFTGWIDVSLSKNGIIEAKNCGKILKNKKFYTFTKCK